MRSEGKGMKTRTAAPDELIGRIVNFLPKLSLSQLWVVY